MVKLAKSTHDGEGTKRDQRHQYSTRALRQNVFEDAATLVSVPEKHRYEI